MFFDVLKHLFRIFEERLVLFLIEDIEGVGYFKQIGGFGDHKSEHEL